MANFESNVERVNAIVKKINAEALSLGAVVRNFVEVAKEDDYARYMLQTICNHHADDALIVLKVNDIKKAVIAAYPYKNEDNVLLVKRDGIYVPIEKYNGAIISKAFYNAVGATKVPKDFRPATKEEVAEAEAKAEEKKAERKATAEQKKADADLKAKLWEEVMGAGSADQAWEIVQKYKAQTVETEATSK